MVERIVERVFFFFFLRISGEIFEKKVLGLINQSLTLAHIYIRVIWQEYKNKLTN